MSHQYRLTEKILAVSITADQKPQNLVYVPAGAVVSVEVEDVHEERTFVPVQYESQTVLLFRQDLNSRAEPITESLYYAVRMSSSCAVRQD